MAYGRNSLGRLEMHPRPPVTRAKICIIGEYPNMTELREGQYFISSGADVLRQTLQNCDIKLEDCYFTVAVPYLMNKKNKKLPTERWIKERTRLLREIKESGATLVMPLGVLALGLLLDQKSVKIKSALGNLIDIPGLPNVTCIPNYHPAMLLHSPGNYKVFQRVITSLSRLYFGYPMSPGKTKWYWVDTKDKIKDLITTLSNIDWTSADIETSSLDTKEAMIWVMGVRIRKNYVAVIPREMFLQAPKCINELFGLFNTRWVWHHGKYDTEVLHWKNFEQARLDEDTIYQHYCLNETNGSHGLGTLATMYLGADEYKSKMNSEFAHITNEDAYYKYKQDLGERVAIDADYTGQLFEIFEPLILENANHKKLYQDMLMPASNYLRKMQMRGVKIDKAYLESRTPVYEGRIDQITTRIQDSVKDLYNPTIYREQTGAKSASVKFKPTSVPQMKWMIYDVMKLKPTHKDAKKRGTGAEVLASINAHNSAVREFLTLVLDLRKVKKEYSTYVKSYLKCMDENDLVHATFNLHITATGRLSCVEPNLQNVPSSKPDVRRAFIPRGKNRILMEIDYSGAELRVLAFISGDVNLTRALTEGDPHGELAETIFAERYTLGTTKEKKNLRGRAKTVNFGVAYGRQAPSIAEAFNISLEEAQTYIDAWAAMYPQAWVYLQSCEDDVRSGTPLLTLYGRYRRFGLIHKANLQDLINEAKNYRIQSISSDNLLKAVMLADGTLEQQWEALATNLVHDSVLIDSPADPDTMHAVATYMVDTMINVPRQYGCTVPFKSDVDLGLNWGDLMAYDVKTRTLMINNQSIPYVDWYNDNFN